MTVRYRPNIIITGTPGCGKTSHCEALISGLNNDDSYSHINVSDFAKENKCFESYDQVLDTHVVDEDKLLDLLEVELEKGGRIVDWHCCDVFPERLIDLVVVLRSDNSNLFDRLSKRGYNEIKLQENLDCEIMEVILNEAREGYQPEIVIALESNSAEDMDENVDRILAWIDNWVKDHQDGVTNELDPDLKAKLEAERDE
ncbi:factor activating pos9 [Scheffersomyces spartinae]|uniref:Adenylate kinase isoenzyme 6 homolog n=1 Tax=Scheffersomyces spartinae TaxID=45513 RepID=A0A9P7VA64_9ASCO|nr:factor activating pos9 [Scheffersomyces spartinae]KAG7194172.1 factor activating pos9 [Scheffersomyces spartinae]